MTFTSQSAMLAGFCYSGISLTRHDEKQFSSLLSFLYLVATTASLGFGLLTVIDTTLTNIFGPGLALRGKDGPVSVHKAVKFMY